jgi:hypothetical protein
MTRQSNQSRDRIVAPGSEWTGDGAANHATTTPREGSHMIDVDSRMLGFLRGFMVGSLLTTVAKRLRVSLRFAVPVALAASLAANSSIRRRA